MELERNELTAATSITHQNLNQDALWVRYLQGFDKEEHMECYSNVIAVQLVEFIS